MGRMSTIVAVSRWSWRLELDGGVFVCGGGGL